MKQNNLKAWLYLLPAILFLVLFLVYPLIQIIIFSFEEKYNFVTQSYTGIGFYNFNYVLHDQFFVQALKNTLIMVIITVPISTGLAVIISVGLSKIKVLRNFFQSVYFLPYVTNTLAVGLVFMIIFDQTETTDGLMNLILRIFNVSPIDFIDGPYWAKMLVLCIYVIWIVMPFKILVLLGALQSVKKDYYDAAKIDQADRFTIFRRITVPMIAPYISYLVITGFIGAFKQYNDAVALFGTDLDAEEMNTIVGYIYSQLPNGEYGTASAAALILFGIIFIFPMINLYLSKKSTHY